MCCLHKMLSHLQILEQISIAESEKVHGTFPACAYAALELCERHLAALKNQLKQVGKQFCTHALFACLDFTS